VRNWRRVVFRYCVCCRANGCVTVEFDFVAADVEGRSAYSQLYGLMTKALPMIEIPTVCFVMFADGRDVPAASGRARTVPESGSYGGGGEHAPGRGRGRGTGAARESHRQQGAHPSGQLLGCEWRVLFEGCGDGGYTM
jgi:hypothetical protein